MDNMEIFNLIEKYERVELELTKYKIGEKLSEEAMSLVNNQIDSEEKRLMNIDMIKEFIKNLKDVRSKIDDGKLYLSEIIEKENITFKSNSLILSPVGSGKTNLIKKLINEGENILLLVSTSSLKHKLAPESEEKRKFLKNRMYSSKIKTIYGEGTHKILVMTYAEFGERVKYSNKFPKVFNKIFCDEFHSLPLYQNYNNSPSLLVAIHYLLGKNDEQQKFYFTATSEHLDELKDKAPDLFEEIDVYNFLEHEEIKRYKPNSSYEITGIEQIRSHLRARLEGFKHFKYKIFAFCKTIESQLKLKQMCEEEGFSAQAYWSFNNEDKAMTDEQKDEMLKMIEEEKLPDKYDVVIINSALQEGWDLKDPRVKLAIINTINETEFTQSLGRIRNNIDILIYKVKKDEFPLVDFPKELIGVEMDTDKKKELVEQLGLKNKHGRIIGWTNISKALESQGFFITQKQIKENGKRKMVSIVHSI